MAWITMCLSGCSFERPFLPWTPEPPIIEKIDVSVVDTELTTNNSGIRLNVIARDPRDRPLKYYWTSYGSTSSFGSGLIESALFSARDAASTVWLPPTTLTDTEYNLTVEVSNGVVSKERTLKIVIFGSGLANITDTGARDVPPGFTNIR